MAPEFAPPQYAESLLPTLLCLDGGGSRTITQLYLLIEIMHRLHWDLASPSPSRTTKSQYSSPPQPTPSECFDYVGGGGMGALVAFLLACGYSATQARDKFIDLVPRIMNESENSQSLSLVLESVVPKHESLWYGGRFVVDFAARCGVWVNGEKIIEEKKGESQGTLIKKGSPVILELIPLVVKEIQREISGKATTLHYTLPFLQSICPVFQDCSLLLSLGSGDVAPTAKAPQAPTRSYSPTSFLPSLGWLSSSSLTKSTPPPLPSSRPTLQDIRALNKYIPTYAYGRQYQRFQPSLTTWSMNGEQSSPREWESDEFGTHKMMVSAWCSRVENASGMDEVVEVIKRRDWIGSADDTSGDSDIDMQGLVFESARYY